MDWLSWLRGRAMLCLMLPFILACPACGADTLQAPRTFYVDFDQGSDQANGTSATQAWRRAPGDPEAEGAPARTVLKPGDVVLFRGGVTYRGAIRIAASGEPGRPITYGGEGFGPGKAVISGRDNFEARVRACESEPACADLPGSGALRVVDLPSAVRPSDQIVVNGRLLELAQAPGLPDAFWFDDLNLWQPLPRDQLRSDGTRWTLRSDLVKRSLGRNALNDLVVQLWGMPNAVADVAADAYDPATGELTLTIPKFQPYPDRDGKFALVNHPAFIRHPFEYATLAHGRSLVVQAPLPPGPVHMEITRRDLAFNAGNQKHLVVAGFEIVGFAGGPDQPGSGGAFRAERGGADLTFRRNEVHDLNSWAGAGAVQANGVSDLRVEDNRFVRLWRAGGVFVGGHSSNVRILRNDFDHIGRTGVMIVGAQRVWIDHNRMSGIRGHHGNGMSVYLDNQDVLVSNNLIQDTTRAITFHGAAPGASRIAFRNNLIRVTGDDGAAIESWSNDQTAVAGVSIESNVLQVDGGRFALKLSAADHGMVIRNNLISGFVLRGAPAADWVVQDNTFAGPNYFKSPEIAAALEGHNAKAANPAGALGALFAPGSPMDPKLCRLLTPAESVRRSEDIAWLEPKERAQALHGVGPDKACGG